MQYIVNVMRWLAWNLWGRRKAMLHLREKFVAMQGAYLSQEVSPPQTHVFHSAGDKTTLPRPDTDDSGLN